MKEIVRKQLAQLVKLQNVPDIKVITGVRRAGKSVLLRQLETHIRNSEPGANVISINLSSVELDELRDYKRLYRYVSERFVEGKHNVVLVDEVELCRNFEWTVNSWHAEMKYDIFITGSNAFLLSSDLATLFAGRVFPIEVFPFSLAEFVEYFEYDESAWEAAFERYLVEGGFAGAYNYTDTGQKKEYLSNLYHMMIMRDIEQKYGVKNVELLHNLGDFLIDNVGNITSSNKIATTLQARGKTVSHVSVGRYLDYLTNAFAFYKVGRYNIGGRLRLASLDKYYLVDHAVRQAVLDLMTVDRGRVIENIVAIELLRRGYEIYMGKYDEREVDFVALRGGEKLYIQVCAEMISEQIVRRETRSLLTIKDNFPKMILTRTGMQTQWLEGIKIVDIVRWLMRADECE